MLRLLIRRVLLAGALIPLLNVVGFVYARAARPLHFDWMGGYVYSNPHTEQLWSDYRLYVQNLFTGYWGLDDIAWHPALTATLQLLGVTVVVVVLLGPLLGFLALSPRTRRVRPSAVTFFTVGSTVPGFFLATLAMTLLIIGKRQGWYEARGYLIPIQGNGWDAHLILPVATLALRPILYTASITASLIEHELQQDYVQVARSRGLSWWSIIRRHTFPNVQAATLLALGQGLQFVISSLLLVEFLFDWRGLGWLFVRAFIEPGRGSTSSFLMNEYLVAVLLPFFGFLMLVSDTIPRLIAFKRDYRLSQA